MKYAAYPASRLLDALEERQASVRVIVLDACRDNPFRAWQRSVSGGFTSMNAEGAFVAFAAAKGKTADDNPSERNGLFTTHLIHVLREPGLPVSEVFDRVRDRVWTASGHKQRPFSESGLIGTFRFRPPIAAGGETKPASTAQVEIAHASSAADQPVVKPVAGESRRNQKDGLVYLWIPEGSFEMGCAAGDEDCEPDEKDARVVRLSRGYWIGKTEVPADAFRKFVEATRYRTMAERDRPNERLGFTNGDKRPGGTKVALTWRTPLRRNESALDSWPVAQVSWEDARAFCAWAGGRLPTEAQWERAARGGKERMKYVWGRDKRPEVGSSKVANVADVRERAQYKDHRFDRVNARLVKAYRLETFDNYDDGYAEYSPVASFAANGFGLHDMAGNVWEWCLDWYDPSYFREAPSDDPMGPSSSGDFRVLRGGSWSDGPHEMRISARYWVEPELFSRNIGLRCTLDQANPMPQQ